MPPSHRTRLLALLSVIVLPVLALTAVLTVPAPRSASGEGEARTYVIDKVHSALLFKVSHLGVSYTHGRFNDFNGMLVVDEANPANSKVEIDISAESIDTNSAERDKHLRSKEFFNVEEHPSISFESTSVKPTGKDEVRVAGKFTLLGVSKDVTFRMKKVGAGQDPWGNFRIGYEGQVVIKRTDYGMTAMAKPGGIGDEVYITLAIEGLHETPKKAK